MNMKKVASGLIVAILILMVAACSSSGSGGSSENGSGGDQVVLTVFSSMEQEQEQAALQSVIDAFEEEHPNISVDLNTPSGGGYEDLMRVKMAANDMPDLFDTHGWAQLRYGEYVADLSDMEWVERLDPALEPILKDEDGKVYAYPLNQAKDGMTYNATLLEELGIEPPTTFSEFLEALEAVKEKTNGDVTPLWFPGGNPHSLAQFKDVMATPLLITHPDHDYSESLLDGSFDWTNYTYLPEVLLEMKEKGLLNEDVLTAMQPSAVELMAQKKIAFSFIGGSFGPEVSELNPEVKVGTLPALPIHEGDSPSWIGGERYTFAVSEQTPHLEEAKLFIEFLAQPENAKTIAEGTSLTAGLIDVDAENYYSEYYDVFSDVEVQPYFDRVFLPSGMWDVMGTTSAELLSGTLTPEQVSAEMEKEYLRLREQ